MAVTARHGPLAGRGESRTACETRSTWATETSIEWRTGFPYSDLRIDRTYETPNTARFPDYASVDLTVFKTFDILKRQMDLGLQFFNHSTSRWGQMRRDGR